MSVAGSSKMSVAESVKSDKELIQDLREENRLLQDQIKRVLELNEKLLEEIERMNDSRQYDHVDEMGNIMRETGDW